MHEVTESQETHGFPQGEGLMLSNERKSPSSPLFIDDEMIAEEPGMFALTLPPPPLPSPPCHLPALSLPAGTRPPAELPNPTLPPRFAVRPMPNNPCADWKNADWQLLRARSTSNDDDDGDDGAEDVTGSMLCRVLGPHAWSDAYSDTDRSSAASSSNEQDAPQQMLDIDADDEDSFGEDNEEDDGDDDDRDDDAPPPGGGSGVCRLQVHIPRVMP